MHLRNGNIAIDTIFIFVVSIIAIFFLLMLFSGKFPAVGKEVYCKTFFHLASSNFFPEPIRQSQDYCTSSDKDKPIIFQANPRIYYRSTLADGSTTARISGSGVITLAIPEDARIISTNFTFFTKQTLASIELDVGSDGSVETTLLNPPSNERFSIINQQVTDEIYRQLNNSAKPCPLGECQIQMTVNAGDNVSLSGLKIEYSSCAIVSSVIAQMQLCAERTIDSAENVVCGEIAVSSGCRPAIADSSEIANRLVKENLCEQLPMESYSCGAGEKVLWQLTQINPSENILIEYRGATKQIAVS